MTAAANSRRLDRADRLHPVDAAHLTTARPQGCRRPLAEGTRISCGDSAANGVTSDPSGSAHPARLGSVRACTPSSCSRRHDQAVPEPFECRSRSREGAWRTNAECVACHTFRDAGTARRVGDPALDCRLVQMKARRRTETHVPADASRRKHQLPSPLHRSVRKLSLERVGEHHTAETRGQGPVRASDARPRGARAPARVRESCREASLAGPSVLSAPHGDFAPVEIDVLHPQVETLLKPETGAVQE